MAPRSELDPITISFQEKFSQSKSFYDIVKWCVRQEVTSNFCENHLKVQPLRFLATPHLGWNGGGSQWKGRRSPLWWARKIIGIFVKLLEFDKKNQVRTAREDPSSHRILLPNSGLFFLRAEEGRRMADSGIYWCRAENSVGTVTSRKARLQVSCKWQTTVSLFLTYILCSVLDQEFRGLPSDLEVALGSSVVLPCQVKLVKSNQCRVLWREPFSCCLARLPVVHPLHQSHGFKAELW